ncbi:MAG: nucleotidyltransferase family protein [Candidatus Micrarchaeota archaeon]|nr:nucleotidyltransferase family protein [Candidatus Micrarchaeota archaeon]
MILMKAVIFAGGFGKRLRPLTDKTPKPLLEVGGKPIMEWQISWLKPYGVNSFIVTTSYLPEKIAQFAKDSSKLGVELDVIVEKEPLGKGGALKNVKDFLKGEHEFLVLNGDVITNIDITDLKLNNYVASLALVPLQSTYGIVNVKSDYVTSFVEKPVLPDYWINAGVYKMNSDIFKYLPDKGEIEDTTFPELARNKLLGATKFAKSYWKSTDSLKDMEDVNKDLLNKKVFRY